MAAKKKTIVSIVGARPQFVKLACLAPVLGDKFKHIIVHSGQHYDNLMSDVFFNQLDIPKVDYNLEVGSGNHGDMTGRIMTEFECLLEKIKPEMVLVYGDTNSTLAGSLTASKMHIPVGHIEAGLRSFNMDMPEEINRRVTDHVSSLLFAPTAVAVRNLKKEGIIRGVVRSGDLMYELIDYYRDYIDRNVSLLDQYGLTNGEFLLMTMHRAGNVDCKDNLSRVVNVLSGLRETVFFAVHPRTMKNLKRFKLYGKLRGLKNVVMSDPLSYLDNLTMIRNAKAVMTDSGGVQKEALFLGTPCLTLRDETEWIETLQWGNHLVGLSGKKIKKALRGLTKVKRINYKITGLRPTQIILSNLLKMG